MSDEPVRFLFDFISPYAFLAWTQIRAIAQRHRRPFTPVPVLFAALLDAHGTKGPAEVPAKRRYLFKDVARKAWRLGVPSVTPPPAHPFNPLLALRIASLPDAILPPAERDHVIDALFHAVWTKRQPIDTPEAVTAVLGASAARMLDEPSEGGARPKAAASRVASLIEAASASETKTRLRQATEEAVAQGVFGVPSVLVGSELFWGTESLADLEAFLGNQLPDFSDAGWADLKPSATRPGSRASPA